MLVRILFLVVCIAEGIAGGPAWGQTKNQPTQPQQPTATESTYPKDLQKDTDSPVLFKIVHGPQSQTETTNTQSAGASKDIYDRLTAWSAAIAALFTLALAIIGYFGVRAANRTLKAIERQADLTKSSLALTFPPKLMIRTVVLHRSDFRFGMPWCVEFTIVNTGGSSAHIIESYFESSVFDKGEVPFPLPYSGGTEGAGTWNGPLSPGEEKTFYVKIDDPELIMFFQMYGTHDPNGMIHQRSRYMYFFGYAKYGTDGMEDGQKRATKSIGVLRHYNLRRGRFEAIPDPDCEYAD